MICFNLNNWLAPSPLVSREARYCGCSRRFAIQNPRCCNLSAQAKPNTPRKETKDWRGWSIAVRLGESVNYCMLRVTFRTKIMVWIGTKQSLTIAKHRNIVLKMIMFCSFDIKTTMTCSTLVTSYHAKYFLNDAAVKDIHTYACNTIIKKKNMFVDHFIRKCLCAPLLATRDCICIILAHGGSQRERNFIFIKFSTCMGAVSNQCRRRWGVQAVLKIWTLISSGLSLVQRN